jgi:hypothetical protein
MAFFIVTAVKTSNLTFIKHFFADHFEIQTKRGQTLKCGSLNGIPIFLQDFPTFLWLQKYNFGTGRSTNLASNETSNNSGEVSTDRADR